MRWGLGVLVVLLAWSQYVLWFSPNGVRSVWRLRAELQQQTAENKRLMRRNQQVLADIHDLKSGNDAIEERARRDLGMVKRGESFYQEVK